MTNQKTISELLTTNSVDAYLIYDFRGSNFIGRKILDFSNHTTRRFCAFISPAGIKYIAPRLERTQFANCIGEIEYYSTYGEFHELLQTELKKYKRLAMDISYGNDLPINDLVPHGFVELVEKLHPKVELLTSSDLSQQLSATWGDAGYKSHKFAVNALNKIFEEVFAFVSENIAGAKPLTDLDVMRYALERYDHYGIYSEDEVCIIATGLDTTNPHYYPREDRSSPIRKNSVLLVDMWAKQKGQDMAVYGDMTKLAWIGPEEPPKELIKTWKLYNEAIDTGLDVIYDKVGTGNLKGYEVDRAIVDVFKKHHLDGYLMHRSGHSLGVYEHGNGANLDDYETHDTRAMIADSGFTIEPGLYLEEYAVRSELNFYIKSDLTVEITSGRQKDIVIV